MPRPKNPIRSDLLRLTITSELRSQLDQLVQTGRYGMNANDAAYQLISEAVDVAFAKVRTFLENRAAVGDMLARQGARSKSR